MRTSKNTRVELGKGKVMNPTLLWKADSRDGEKFWGRVSVSDSIRVGTGTVTMALLGSDGGFDDVRIHARSRLAMREKLYAIHVSGANGQLITNYAHLLWSWQDAKGGIFEG